MNKNNKYNKYKDASGNKNSNMFIFNLQPSNKKKSSFLNNYINDNSDNLQLDIKSNNTLFTMKIDSILDDILKNRVENENKIKDNTFDTIKDSLDKTEDFNNTIRYNVDKSLEIVPFNKKIYRSTFNKILNNIDKRYNITFNNNLSKNIIKSLNAEKNIDTQYGNLPPPPPFPTSLFGNTSNNAPYPILNPLINKQHSTNMGFSQGIFNKDKNVLGMMPHPERASDLELGNNDGGYIFQSIISVLELA